jgi:hypothetical protein
LYVLEIRARDDFFIGSISPILFPSSRRESSFALTFYEALNVT